MTSSHSLPKMDIPYIHANQLLDLKRDADLNKCKDNNGTPLLTLLDFRNENFLSKDDPPPRIPSQCQTIFLQMDDIRDPSIRRQIPKQGQIVTITETGNRDSFAIRYLSTFGFNNIRVLKFGMRGWLKLRYPISETTD